jgi:hypothetical protein
MNRDKTLMLKFATARGRLARESKPGLLRIDRIYDSGADLSALVASSDFAWTPFLSSLARFHVPCMRVEASDFKLATFHEAGIAAVAIS